MRSLRERAVPVTMALLTLLLAAALLLVSRHVVELEAEDAAAMLAAKSVTEVSSAIGMQMNETALAAASSRRQIESTDEVISTSLATRVLARDSGEAVLDDADGGVTVAARYDASLIPATVEERRRSVVGYVVLPLSLDVALIGLVPPDHQIVVDGSEERVASTSNTVAGRVVTRTVSFKPGGADAWAVTVSRPAGRPPALAWGLALLVLVGGGGVAAAIDVRQRASRVRRAELQGLQETNAVVAGLSGLAQQSRDLGELLPSLTTELAASLGLRGLALTTATASGDRPLFGWGIPPDGGESAVGLHEVEAGQAVWLRLSRGGRTAARLWVVAGRDLDQYDVNTLVAVGDLVASALTNAEAFAEQRSLVERMQAVDQLKSVFLSTASHELRTPVAAIAGFSSVLNDSWDDLEPEQARSLVARVDRNAQRLSQMVEDLLDFSRLERSNPLTQEHAPLDLGEVVGQVLREQPDLVADHDVTYLPVSGLVVSGSHEALERVITNLVGNAAKYSPPGSQIRVLVHEQGGTVELVVEDDGPGIPQADRERVFSRFYRGTGDAVTRTRGTGLGLAIVTEFAATMGGSIRLEESGSGGARFVVNFPRTPMARSTTPEPPAPERPVGAPTSGVRRDRT